MISKRPRRLTALGAASLLALTMVIPAAVSADPVVPAFNITSPTDQAGVYDPANGKFNSAWFTLQVVNGGTSTYTQMHLTLTPSNPTVVARAALDATKSVPTTASLCTIVGNGFDCVWPTNLGGGQSTSPLTFVFAAPNDPTTSAPPPSFDVAAFFQSKDHTTSSSGGSGQDRDVSTTDTIHVNASPRIDEQTPYLGPTTSSFTVSTWKKNGVAQLTLPASTTGYLVDLAESAPGANGPTGCDLNDNGTNTFAWAQYASANVNRNAAITPYLEWKTSAIWDNRDGSITQTGPVPNPPTGVYHCIQNPDGTYTRQTIDAPCTSSLTTNCIVKIQTQIQGKKGSIFVLVTYTVTFRTPTNGLSKPK